MIRSDRFEHETSRFARIAIDDACSHNLDPSSLSLWAAVSLLGTETPNLGFNSIKCQFEPPFSISLPLHPMIAVFILFRNSPSFEEADHGERRRGRCENDLDFFCFFLRSRPAGGDGFGKGSTLGRLEMVTFDFLRRRQVKLILISTVVACLWLQENFSQPTETL